MDANRRRMKEIQKIAARLRKEGVSHDKVLKKAWAEYRKTHGKTTKPAKKSIKKSTSKKPAKKSSKKSTKKGKKSMKK